MNFKKTVSMLMAGILTLSAMSVSASAASLGQSDLTPIVAAEQPGVTDKTPRQLNIHMGDDASTSVNITYTTAADCESVITVKKQGSADAPLTFQGTSDFGQANKCFHAIAITGLEPGTTYEYTVGEGSDTKIGKFKTAPEKGSTDTFKFAYIADTQVSNASNAKALGATLAEVNKIEGLDFVYLAGDTTDTATNENQWEWLFNNDGAFPTGGEDMFSNNTVAVVQGNHDNNTLNRHINAPAQAGNIVYSFDYGPAKFIMLNLEAAKNDSDARAKQEELLRAQVAEAKSNGQWTLVGFHKSLYTGASHITDSDVTAARKFWGPIFAELDVDVVMQGHDHVYSRGFVNADGTKADRVVDENGKVKNPENAPLYMVGGHAGGLKWYSKKNYTVSAGDPLTAGYAFLDVNSTDGKDGKAGSDVLQEQVIVEIEMSNDSFTLNTYMFKYDTNTDTITTPKYLYDTLTVTRDVMEADLTGSEEVVLENGDTAAYNISVSNFKNTNVFQAEVTYDANVLEFVSAESKLDGTIFTRSNESEGKVSLLIGTNKLITSTDPTNIITFNFKVKETASVSDTVVNLSKISTAQARIDEATGEVNDASVVNPNAGERSVVTGIYSYKIASDINRDGIVNLADLSIALANYQSTVKPSCDIDRSGVVDTADFIIIADYMAA